MFKSGRWRSEKNKIKVVFKLHFHAAQVTQVVADTLIVSVVSADTGKATLKSDKATIRDGSCIWENPVYETVKFNRDTKSGKIQERIYHFVVGTGSSKAGVIGEASIDFSSYVEKTKVSLVSLPLKNSKTEAVLNVSIQRILESTDQREFEEDDDAKMISKDHSLRLQLGNSDTNGITRTTSFDDMQFNKTVATVTDLNVNRRASVGSDITITSSESSSGVETPWEPQMKNVNVQLAPSTDNSSSTPRESFIVCRSEEVSDVIEKLKTEVSALSRQAEISELELQTLRKHIVKESKRGNDLFKEVVSLKEERDALKADCERRVSSRRYLENKTSLHFDGGIVEELRQELNHAKEINANLQIQLQKTQESNSELILAVKDLDEMLDQKDKEISKMSNGLSTGVNDEKSQSDDEEQTALEELVKKRTDSRETYLLEQQITDMRNELEIYKRDKEELETQMEQLALDYEIMKQENHDMSCKLKQSELQEQLKMQYECTSNYSTAHELEIQIENLENELKKRSKESESFLVSVNKLEARVKSLEEELEKQAQVFEADLECVTCAKVEQEQRAIRAEEMLRKTRLQNANTAERLQEEFRRLSVQMTSTFEANENLATKALAEANELRYKKSHLEELLQKAYEECETVKEHYEVRVSQLSSQVTTMTKEIETLYSEIEAQKKHGEEMERLLSNEIVMMKKELGTNTDRNKILSEELLAKEDLIYELAQMRESVKEMELVIEKGNKEKIELESRLMVIQNEAEESNKKLYDLRCVVQEKERLVVNLQSDIVSLQSEYTALKKSVSSGDLDKEKLRKQVFQLKGELKKREDALSNSQKKIKDGSIRGAAPDTVKLTSKTGKILPHASKEVANLKEKIKLLESQVKVKEDAVEKSTNAFIEKEKNLHYKIEELEGRLIAINQSNTHCCENEVASVPEDQDDTNNNGVLDELRKEMELLKERNKSREEELKEMQERYSEISLKFAEVEGERQELVMKVRNLQNSKKS